MIQLSYQRMQKAIAKARTVKPFVHVEKFGSYTVRNKQTGASYLVMCEKRNGKPFAVCSCKAGQQGFLCYHVASAAAIHIQLAAERAELNF